MSDRRRNIMVGLSILVALGACLYGVILLGKFPFVGTLRQYKVALVAANANGISTGSRVELNGVYAGQVTTVYLMADPNGKLIAKAEMQIDNAIKIPVSTTATIVRSSTGVGNPSVTLNASDYNGPNLPTDGSAVLTAISSDSGLIPREVIDDIHIARDVVKDKFGPAAEQLSSAARELTTVARDLHILLAYTPPEAISAGDPNDPNRPRENASTAIIRINRTVDSLQKLLTDPQLQGNVRAAIQNITDASAQLKSTLEKINKTADGAGTALSSFNSAAMRASSTLDSTQKDIDRVSDQLIQTLASVDKAVKQISEGNGTTGRLINDPRLFESLVDLSKSLKTTVDKLDFLLDKWKDEGVNLRLK